MSALESRTAPGRAAIAALSADPGTALIALDFDGTLAPIVADPAQARADPGVAPVLTRLAARIGTIAIITGRPAAIAVEYGGLGQVPGLIVLGHYGLERWAGGGISAPPPPPGIAAVRAELPELLARVGAPRGTWLEDKGASVAVHTRRTADPAGALAALAGPLRDLAARHALVVEPGRLVLELRPPGVDKGAALTGLFAERAAEVVLFCGDDLGDLAAFDAVDDLRGRGFLGLKVCSGSAEVTELAARADLVVDGPPGVVELLAGLADSVGT